MYIRIAYVLMLLMLVRDALHAQSAPVAALPVTAEAPAGSDKRPLVLFITGDGGMKKFSVSMMDAFTQEGYAVVALNSLKYFWKKKTPEQAAADVAALLRHYGDQWGHRDYWLVGYSMGADVLPFIFNSLPAAMQAQASQLVLMSPSQFTDMEVHIAGMLGKTSKSGMDVAAAVNRIIKPPLLLLFGEGEDDFDLKTLHISHYKTIVLPGGHHYDNEAGSVVQAIIKNSRRD
jgi:type IV secretory pathway VirJ component